jgi:excisionase family DNA binding protein
MRRQGDHGAPTELVPMEPPSTAGPPGHGPAGERAATAADPSALPLMAREILASLGLQVIMVHSAPPAPPRVVEADDVAAVLNVTKWSIYRWAAQGRIPCVRAGRKVRFELERVIAALRSEGPRVGASPATPSVQVTAGSRATRTAKPCEAQKRRQVAGGTPRTLPPRRAQPTVSAQRERAAARQEPVDEIALRRAVVAATRALSE